MTRPRVKLYKSIILICQCLCLLLVSLFVMPQTSYAQNAERKQVRVGWYDSAYCYVDKYGRRTGMAYEYQQKIAAYTNWDYEYVEGTWSELLQMLENGEIDLLSDVSFTEERAEKILYPELPMGTESYYIYARAGSDELNPEDLSTFNKKRFGVSANSVQEKMLSDWAKTNKIELKIVELYEQAADYYETLLSNGIIDAFISYDTYAESETCTPIRRIGATDYFFAVNKNRPDLLSDLNSAMGIIYSGDIYYNQKLMEKYIWAVKTDSFITQQEEDWLAAHGKIRIGYRDDYLPFCTYDKETDSLDGGLKDFIVLARNALTNAELEFETVPYKTVEEAIAALQNGEIDCVFPIRLSPYDSEQMNILTTDPLMSSEVYIIAKSSDHRDFTGKEEMTVALRTGNTNYETFVMDCFPKWNIIHNDERDGNVDALVEDRADCMLISGYRINTMDEQRHKYKLSIFTSGERMEFSLATKDTDGELYTILNKVTNLVPSSSIESALSQYSVYENKVSFREYLRDNMAAVVGVFSTVIIIILILLIQSLKSEKRATERQRLISATELDPLTKLYNRSFFFEYANRMYKNNPERQMDAIVLNVDQFHAVNDMNGWKFGDEVLKAIGEEIKGFLDEHTGIACRSQADRYDIYCRHLDEYQSLFDRIQKRLDELSQNVNIRLRMGVMPWQKGVDPVKLFDRARTACGMIRGGNKSRIMIFDEKIRNQELRDQRLLNDLRRAVEAHEFIVYYQPKYDIRNDVPVLYGAEALVRWKHHELGMIPPFEFVSLFEKNMQIGILDKYVWEEAARQIARWKEKFGIDLTISVNLSRLDVFDPDLEKTLERLVTENKIDRGLLNLEVTESAYTDNADHIIKVVNELRKLGHHIEMDDFGTGFSSLNMLSVMPIDILKMDRAFITNIGNNDTDEQMVELILDIAKNLKVPVVAEGVETKEQLEFLKVRGCEIVQGYYFSPPLPADEFEEKIIKK